MKAESWSLQAKQTQMSIRRSTMTVVYLYTEEWNFVRSCEGMTEQDAISKVPEDFKGYAVVQGEKRKQYHFK